MTFDDLPSLLPLAALYAETHYRFRFFPFSLYYRRAPEIIFDAPYRVEPGQPVPVALIVKDGNRFPVRIEEVTLTLRSGNGLPSMPALRRSFRIDEVTTNPLHYYLFEVDPGHLSPGEVALDAQARVRQASRIRIVHNDNYPGLTHSPLRIHLAADPLPSLPDWTAGELHCHTSYGSDQVEFGAPLEVIQRFAAALGHGWATLTDHSYNLDDLPDDYLKRDPALAKWNALWDEADRLNQMDAPCLIPGEELTCRNARGRNVHMIILGNREFLHGSGDGAERWFRTESEWSVGEALARISPQAFAAAAHPLAPTPPLEYLLVRRGSWEASDLAEGRLDGWQIANGEWDEGFRRGYDEWRKALLSGEMRIIFGGNDAHGNFNRFRQVRLPMVRLQEHHRNRFGVVTTRVKAGPKPRPAEVIAALKAGEAVVSDGPALALRRIERPPDGNARPEVEAVWSSSDEFGPVRRVSLFGITRDLEVDFLKERTDDPAGRMPYGGSLRLTVPDGANVRAELETIGKEGRTHRAFTNPILLK
ncbi:MAG: hypothetical protein FJY67_05590 [Calditrichaeota bacterium]|nr:hypothetical protein [Calditrichota bacterium]